MLALSLLSGCASGQEPTKPAERPHDVGPTAAGRPSAATPPMGDAEKPPTVATPAPIPPASRPLPDGYLSFAHACDLDSVVTLGAAGDVLLHRELQKQAFAAEDRYVDLWSGIGDLLAKPDITYANLEGPAATGISRGGAEVKDPGLRFDNRVYSGYARFNYHPSVAEDLLKSGVDLVSTANNHTFDRYELGVERTIEALDAAGLRHIGTRRRGSKAPWHVVTEAGGLRIGWVACTQYTNFHKDTLGQVLYCFKDDRVRELVSKLYRDDDIDAVIVAPHWGKEYETTPRKRQVEHAQRWVEAGAVAIIGAHPHVLQPWDKLEASDGREAFVVYSLGNFVSHQRELPRRSSILLYLGLGQTTNGTVVPAGARYVPLHVRMEGDKQRFFVEAVDRAGGPEEARRIAIDMYGRHNLMRPDEDLVVNPHCDSRWSGYDEAAATEGEHPASTGAR